MEEGDQIHIGKLTYTLHLHMKGFPPITYGFSIFDEEEKTPIGDINHYTQQEREDRGFFEEEGSWFAYTQSRIDTIQFNFIEDLEVAWRALQNVESIIGIDEDAIESSITIKKLNKVMNESKKPNKVLKS